MSMYTVKIDKRGKIIIPAAERKSMKLFACQKFALSFREGQMIIKPFEYKCKWCEADIPEGSEYGSCKECERKKRIRVY